MEDMSKKPALERLNFILPALVGMGIEECKTDLDKGVFFVQLVQFLQTAAYTYCMMAGFEKDAFLNSFESIFNLVEVDIARIQPIKDEIAPIIQEHAIDIQMNVLAKMWRPGK